MKTNTFNKFIGYTTARPAFRTTSLSELIDVMATQFLSLQSQYQAGDSGANLTQAQALQAFLNYINQYAGNDSKSLADAVSRVVAKPFGAPFDLVDNLAGELYALKLVH